MGDVLCQNKIGSVSARMNVMQPVTTQRTVLVWNINMHNTTAHKTPHGSVNRNKLCQGDSVDNPDIYGWKWDSQRWPIKRCNARTLGCGAGCSFGIDVAVFQVLWCICCACHHFMLPGLLCEGGEMLRKAIDVDYNFNAPLICLFYYVNEYHNKGFLILTATVPAFSERISDEPFYL